MLVGEDLDLDVVRLLDALLDEHAAAAKELLALFLCVVEGRAQLLFIPALGHADAAAACACLQHDRPADALGDLDGVVLVLDRVDGPRHDGHAGLDHRQLALDLAAHRPDGVQVRTHKRHTLILAGSDEVLVLRQEAVARVQGVGAAVPEGCNDGIDVAVALFRRGRSDADGLISLPHKWRARVGVTVDSDGRDAQATGGADDTAGNLATVGHEELLRQRHGGDLAALYRRGNGVAPAWLPRRPLDSRSM